MPEARRQERLTSPPLQTSMLAQQFLANELPEALRPTKESHRLQVAVIWGGNQLIEVRDALPGEPFTLGPKGSSVGVYENLAAFGPLPFVQPQKDGSMRLFLPESASPTLNVNEQQIALDELVRSGKAERVDVPVRGIHYELGLHERVVLQFGALQVVARYTRPEWFKRRSYIERMDLNFLSGLVILALTAVVSVKMMQMTPAFSLSAEDRLEKARSITSIFTAVKAPPPPEPKSGASEAPRGPIGTIGQRDREHREAAPPRLNQARTREQNVALVQRTGLLAALNAPGTANTVLGAANSVEGLDRTLGNIHGAAPVAMNGGLDGLGSRGVGYGSGGLGVTIGGVNDGTGSGIGGRRGDGFNIPGIKKVLVPLPPVIVDGVDSGYRDAIARVIKRHWNEIKYCYEKELQKNPNLEGKVAVSFDIGPAGQVTQADSREVTLESSEAQTCILNSVRRWEFPKPPSGVVTVNYPFLFSAAR